MRPDKLTSAQEQFLRDQVINADQPGPVLRDFGILLDFLGRGPVEAAGKYNLLPIKSIEELDQRLSRPLHLDLKRPQIRSHPYLQGLNLLLRASGLSRIEGTGGKARLVLDPAMMAIWDQLNPTERYFNLLEAWLRFGRGEMVGERSSSWERPLSTILTVWSQLPAKGRKFDLAKSREVHLYGIYRNFYQLALMDLFGLLDVKQPSRPVTPWGPASVNHNPFGDAVLTLLSAAEFRSSFGIDSSRLKVLDEDEQEDEEVEDEVEDELEAEVEDGDEEEWEPEVPRFGAWQSLLQPYFPEWRENLRFPEPEFRDGEFIFKVSLGKVWRLIAMPAETTLDDLVGQILHAVDFDFDHLYEFTYRDRTGAEVSAGDSRMDDGIPASLVKIGSLPLEPGQSMQLMYDFGDNWRFGIKLERIDPPGPKAKKPRILESHGKAPEQYQSWDDE